jgi:hypothetical protein
MNEVDEYYVAIIGPVKRSELPWGADFPMKQPIKQAFYDVVGRDAEHCYSGWGNTQEVVDKINKIQNDDFLQRSNTDKLFN